MKKVLSALMVFCVSFLLTGCKGKVKDLNEQLKKFENKIQEGNIYNEDYKITIESKWLSENTLYTTEDIVQKDGDTLYIYSRYNEESTHVWAGEKEGKYYIFVNDGQTKEYSEIQKSELPRRIKNIFYENLLDLFEKNSKSDIEILKQYAHQCSNDVEDLTCTIDKSLFGDELNAKVESKITEKSKDTAEFEFKKGYLKKSKIALYTDDSITCIYDYGNQTISLPAFSEYTKK